MIDRIIYIYVIGIVVMAGSWVVLDYLRWQLGSLIMMKITGSLLLGFVLVGVIFYLRYKNRG